MAAGKAIYKLVRSLLSKGDVKSIKELARQLGYGRKNWAKLIKEATPKKATKGTRIFGDAKSTKKYKYTDKFYQDRQNIVNTPDDELFKEWSKTASPKQIKRWAGTPGKAVVTQRNILGKKIKPKTRPFTKDFPLEAEASRKKPKFITPKESAKEATQYMEKQGKTWLDKMYDMIKANPLKDKIL